MKCDVFHFFVNHGSRLTVPVTQSRYSRGGSVAFVGRLRWVFATFFFQRIEHILKSSLGNATIGAQMAIKFSKSEKIGAKFLLTTSVIYKRDERKLLP